MENLKKTLLLILRTKPLVFVQIASLYFLITGFLHWGLRPDLNALRYAVGIFLGIYFLDAAERFFRLEPSPFRSMVFCGLFVPVSYFVVSSSGSFLASGLVLSLYTTFLLIQAGQWRVSGNLDSWYRMIAVPVSTKTQRNMFLVFFIIFLIETWVFVR